MKKFIIRNGIIEITLMNGRRTIIYLTQDSGKIFYRYKIGTVSNIKHPGICLGIDAYRRRWFMHNHFEEGRPSIVLENRFSKGQAIFLDQSIYINDRKGVLQIGMQQVIDGRPYDAINYNCQTFVNLAINNKYFSEDVQKWIGRAFLGTLILLGFKFYNSK